MSNAYKYLEQICKVNETVYLSDFAGYDHKDLDMSYEEVIRCPTKKRGHALVLVMLLEGFL